MSVRTAADEKREEAHAHVDQAVKALAAILVDRCWGYDEWTPAFQRCLAEAFTKLMEIERDLS